MDFLVNSNELEALYGLSHIQQLVYLRGIRPYMDVKTGLVGIKRGISHQSIAEELYVETIPGSKGATNSRMQIRRAIAALERAGILTIESHGFQLIVKCNLATRDFYVKNKADIRPTQEANTSKNQKSLATAGFQKPATQEADIGDPPQADTPHIKENNYIYLLRQFDNFWRMYPEKKSRERAFETFKQINPDDHLLRVMLQAIEDQIKARRAKESHGEWVPAWKYPSNWLAQKCWEDEVKIELTQENRNAKCRPNNKNTAHDPFWNPETEDTAGAGEDEYKPNNVINLQYYRQQ
jgi:hypothetical protein